MSGGVLYGNAQIMLHGDTYLLTRRKIRALTAAPDHPALLNILATCGYQIDLPDDDALIQAERQKTWQTFAELCTDPVLTTCVQALDQMTETNALTNFQTIADQLPHLKNRAIRDYFTTLADLTNVRTYYKGGQQFVPGGQLQPHELAIFPQQTPEAIETALNTRLHALAAVNKDDLFQLNPLFWWYLQKQKELQVVQIILTAKRCNYDVALLRANLRGLYEQFAA